ncbi:MAG TPA: hypothetical protein VF294_04560, partial [Polyangiaceae bacterium]
MKFISLVVVGFAGLMSVQGCAASVSSEEAETMSTHDALQYCYSNNGLMPSKAALAVAMARELGRWDTAHDLAAPYNAPVQLSSTANCVNNGCKNTIALLGLQDDRITQQNLVDQNVFNPSVYRNDLFAAMDRSASNLSD